jgi:hypothetical protein
MKKTLLVLLLSFTLVTAYSQDTTRQNKVCHNEFGLDATGFMKEFFNFNNAQYQSYYSPTYYLTYRRHFKKANFRFAVGGDYNNDVVPSQNQYDPTIVYADKSFDFSARIGMEMFSELNKHWQVFYGVDFIASYNYEKRDDRYSMDGYTAGEESSTQNIGLAPMLGIRYRVSKRLSLTTESSFSFNLLNGALRDYFTPTSGQYPVLDDIIYPQTKRVYTSYSQPLSIILTFDI